jgi:hypothetical protein
MAEITHGLYVKARNGLKLRDRKVSRLVQKMRTAMHWLEVHPTFRRAVHGQNSKF